MTIRIECPNCHATPAANPRLLGREIKCPECGTSLLVPSAEQIEQARQTRAAARQQEQEFQQTLRRALATTAAPPRWEADPFDETPVPLTDDERRLAAANTSFLRPQAPRGEDMDMTPMVDVTFLLLIFFMITASFSVQKSIQRPAQRPADPSTQAAETPPEENPDVVTVQVDEFNAYNIITTQWDRAVGSKQDLIVALNDAHQATGAGPRPSKLLVQAHEDCIHAAVIAALDAGREAQFESFEVSTVEQFD